MTTGKINQIARQRGEARARGSPTRGTPPRRRRRTAERLPEGRDEARPSETSADRPKNDDRPTGRRRGTDARRRDTESLETAPTRAPTRANAPTPPRRRPGGRPSTNRLPRQLRRGRRTTCRGQARRSHGHRRPHTRQTVTTRAQSGAGA